MAGAKMTRVIIYHRDDKVQLDVGAGEARAGLQESASFSEVRRHQTAPLAAIAVDFPRHPNKPSNRQTEQVEARHLISEDEIGMVLQIAADARQVTHHFDAEFAQFIAIADPG